jgi:hypothetical protein
VTRRALLVTWHYPPSTAVGARRPGQIARGLPDHGWDVRVLCPRLTDGERAGGERRGPEAVTTPRARPSEWVRAVLPVDDRPLFEQVAGAPSQRPTGGDDRLWPKAVRQLRSLALFPDEHAPWIAAALATARATFARGDVDVVVSSTPPFSAAALGAAVARSLGCPHVVDVRDPFTLNAVWPPGPLDAPLRRRLESAVLDDAALVVTVSEGFASKQRTLTATPVEVLTNAFDPEDVTGNAAPPVEGEVVLAHTGTLYEATSDLDALAAGLAQAGRRVRLVNCGKSGAVLRAALDRAGVSDILEDRGVVSPGEAADLRAAAHGLVLLLPGRDDDDGHIPAKLFDYLGSRKPVLAIGPASTEPARLLATLGGQDACSDAAEVAQWLAVRPSDAVRDAGREQEVSAAALARRYAALLDGVVER